MCVPIMCGLVKIQKDTLSNLKLSSAGILYHPMILS